MTEHYQDLFARYAAHFPREADRLATLRGRLADPSGLTDRADMRGHLTASAFIVDVDARAVLLVRHRSLGRLLQPGGHIDLGEAPLAAARREAAEEVGLPAAAQLLPLDSAHPDLPADIDTHLIPARPSRSEGTHWHFDFRYLFLSPGDHWLRASDDETTGTEWLTAAQLESQQLPPDMLTAIRKVLPAF